MLIIVLAFAAGVALGAARLIPSRVLPWVDRWTTASILILLVAMGAKIGSDREILSNLGLLGGQAAILAAAAIAGSVALVWPLDRAARRRRAGEARSR